MDDCGCARGSWRSAAQIPERRGKQTGGVEYSLRPPRRLSQDDFALRTEKPGEFDELSCFQTQLSKDSDNWQRQAGHRG